MAIFTVTSLFDSGAGSLRDFISTTNKRSGADIIDFNTELSGGTINLTSGELGISGDLTINGLGADLLSVDAGENSRIFNVDDGAENNDLEVTIKGLTITEGNSEGFDFGDGGGGIFNREKLTINNSTISGNTAGSGGGIESSGNVTVTNSAILGNTAEGGSGGGIESSGNVTVTNSTISGNTATFVGGGIFNSENLTVTNSTISGNTTGTFGGGIDNSGNVTVSNSAISGNSAEYSGGGISNFDGNVTVTSSTISGNSADIVGGGIVNAAVEVLTVTNSTISGNSATDGGGIGNYGDLTVTDSTISGNTASDMGGGIHNEDSTGTVTSSIVAANTDNKDLGGNPSFTSGGNNLIGNGDGVEGFTSGDKGDLVGTAANPIDPQLDVLQDNGGPTQTQALLTGSPAINAGSNPLNLKFDQRGPGFNRVIGAQADIGAFEVVPEPDSTMGLLGLAVLGVVFIRQDRRQQKTQPKTQRDDFPVSSLEDRL